MSKAIFLDRDGTINLDKGYTYKIDEYEILPGVKEGLRRLVAAGFKLIILTSQSGIGRGYYSTEQFHAYMKHMQSDLSASGVYVTGVFFCPHHKEHGIGEYKTECNCRKPLPGLLLQAEDVHGPFDYERSWSVGDAMRDLEMTRSVSPHIKMILLPKNAGTSDAKPMEESDVPDYKANNFTEAVDIILAHSK